MKRRLEHLVRKRDGRTEFLRSTKLARSIHLALKSVGVDEDWRALEVSAAVLAGLRERRLRAATAAADVLSTQAIAEAVQSVLVATGQPAAAVAFGAVASERSRRRSALLLTGRETVVEGLAAPAGVPDGGMQDHGMQDHGVQDHGMQGRGVQDRGRLPRLPEE